jgi:nucleoid DNA-binding protein
MKTKADIVDDIFIIQDDFPNVSLTKKEIAAVVDCMLKAVKVEVSRGNAIQFRDYLTILPVKKKAKKAHDFQNGKTITMPERLGVKIKASKSLEDYVNWINNEPTYKDGRKDLR